MHIQETIAVVTGAASGLGRATVDMLHSQGARVVAIDLAGPALDALAQLPDTLALPGDVSSAPGMEAAFARLSGGKSLPPAEKKPA